MIDEFLERQRYKSPIAFSIGEQLGQAWAERRNARIAEALRTKNLHSFGIADLGYAEQLTVLLKIALAEGLFKPHQYDERLMSIGWTPGSLMQSDGYLTLEPDMDAADLANTIVEARKLKALHESVRDDADVYQDALRTSDHHPWLHDVELAKSWRGLGHHANSASLNRLQLPDGELRLNALCYPALWFWSTEPGADDSAREYVQVDEYPRYAYENLFAGIVHIQELDHPNLVLPEENRKRGDRLRAAVVRLDCELDPILSLTLDLARLNSKFHEYWVDANLCRLNVYPIRRVGGGLSDRRLFERHLPDIGRILKRDMELAIDPDDINVVVLREIEKPQHVAPKLPTSIERTPAHARPGYLHLGCDIETGEDIWQPIEELTHTLVSGETGSGKSTWLHGVIDGLLAQGHAVDHLYLCDLKRVEFARYADGIPNVTVVDEIPGLLDVVDEVYALMRARHDRAKAAKQTDSTEPLVVLVIDEFANLTLAEPFFEGEDKKRFKRVLNKLRELGMGARSANIRMIVSLQHPIEKHISSAIKFNCPTKVMFRVISRTYTALVFGDADEDLFPLHPRALLSGQAYYQRPGEQPRLFQGTVSLPEASDDLDKVAD